MGTSAIFTENATTTLNEALLRKTHRYLLAARQDELRTAVLSGIAWLEEHDVGDWHVHALREGFSMGSNGECMLGRLTGLGFNETCRLYGLSLEQCKRLGFFVNILNPGPHSEEFLTELWVAAARTKETPAEAFA